MNQSAKSHYTFGDNDLAAARLARLAEAFAPSSAGFLARARPERVDRAVDLGCGLGFSTHLVREATGARGISGYERSAKYLQMARARFPELAFREVDVLAPPYPDQGVDLIYSRFLLTHQPDPVIVMKACLDHLRPGGRLLLEETAELSSPLPTLQRYYALVQEMQAHHGQQMDIGRRLPLLAASLSGATVTSVQVPLTMPASTMARMHAMNIATWKADPYMRKAHGPAELDALEAELTLIADGDSSQPAGLCVMAQVIVERVDVRR